MGDTNMQSTIVQHLEQLHYSSD